MLLGKRPRPQIRRTTSLSEISVDPIDVEGEDTSDVQNNAGQDLHAKGCSERVVSSRNKANINYSSALVSPRTHKGHQQRHDLVDTAHFLRTCGLCKRRLAPGRDIYMYRGDTAFCSSECREQQMKHDEREGGGSGGQKEG